MKCCVEKSVATGTKTNSWILYLTNKHILNNLCDFFSNFMVGLVVGKFEAKTKFESSVSLLWNDLLNIIAVNRLRINQTR